MRQKRPEELKSNNGPNTEVSSLGGRMQEGMKASTTAPWSVPATVVARNKSILCNFASFADPHNFSFFQEVTETSTLEEYISIHLSCFQK